MLIHSPEDLSAFIKDQRKQAKISQQQTAELVGLKQDTISAFEKKPGSTKLSTFFRILAALKLEIHIVPRGSIKWEEEW